MNGSQNVPRAASELGESYGGQLEQSLAMQLVRMFALVALAGGPATGGRERYVRSFFQKRYPGDVAERFHLAFEELTSHGGDASELLASLDLRLTYQEKIFCLLITFEFVFSGEVSEVDLAVVRRLAAMLGVESADTSFIESLFHGKTPSTHIRATSNLISLRITGDPDRGDLYLPVAGLDLLLFKTQNTYCLLRRGGDHAIQVEGRTVTEPFSTHMSSRFNMRIEGHSLRHQDLIHHFRNKVSPIRHRVYVVQRELSMHYVLDEDENAQAGLSIHGSSMVITPLRDDAIVAVNGKRLDGPGRLTLDDTVYVSGFRLIPREIYYHLSSRRSFPAARTKGHYEISNASKSDIFIQDNQRSKWAAYMSWKDNSLVLYKGNCPYQIHVNERRIMASRRLKPGDRIVIHNHFIELEKHTNRITVSRFSFRKLTARALHHVFEDQSAGLEDVSFEIQYGELACIMGPSGSGKSTLLDVLCGLRSPSSGSVSIDGYDIHDNYDKIKDFFGYVPQDDLLVANLTVFENLYYHARLRFPDRTRLEIRARIDTVLRDIRLAEKKHTRVGSPEEKILSGGERKRLNIGMELVTGAEVYFLDEPTSGLSSKDSEKIIAILEDIAEQGKIVVCVMHQPSTRLYRKFDKVVLLDHGGRMAYFGDTASALTYFRDHLQVDQPEGANNRVDEDGKAVDATPARDAPDLLLDSLEASLHDVDGSVIGERRYSPEYWKERFRRTVITSWFSSVELDSAGRSLPPERIMGSAERFQQFLCLVSRSFKHKVRDRSNLLITFLEAPLLGAAVGFILRYAPADVYTLYTNDLLKTFLFITVIVTMFLGMTNSVSEIISDAPLLMRERMLNTTRRGYLGAKVLVLMLFALLQNLLFMAPGFHFIELKELHLHYLFFLCLLSFAAISVGLFISAIPRLSSRAALNIVPLILVPQIILGGALIEYEKMNQELTFSENVPIPEICQFMPSRWAYEGLMVLQETRNSYDAGHESLRQNLRVVKQERESLVILHGEEWYEAELLRLSDDLERFREMYKHLFGNKGVHDAVVVGEERLRHLEEEGKTPALFRHPMFVRQKRLERLNVSIPTPILNAVVLLVASLFLNILTLGLLIHREDLQRIARKIRYWYRLFARRI